MDSAILPPSVLPPAFKNRRTWIIVFGVLEILMGCLLLIVMALVALASRLGPPNPAAQGPQVRVLYVSAVFIALVACAFIVIGIGNVQIRRWARLVMLILSWAWLAMGILAGAFLAVAFPVFMAAARQNSSANMPPDADKIVAGVMLGTLTILYVLIPLVFVVFYSGKNVKATYENSAGAAGGPSACKPVSVLIATGWFALSVLGYLYVLASPALPLFGILFRGWQALAVVAVLEILMVWLTLNIYRQRLLAWKVAIPVIAFGWISFWITTRRMGLEGMYRAMGYSEAQSTQFAPMIHSLLALSAGTAVALVIMLLATRKHYTDAPLTSG